MKNTIRVRKNRNAAHTSRQVKTRFNKEFKLPKGAKHHACLAIFDRANQRPAKKIPLTEQEFYDLWALQFSGDKKYTDELIADLIRQKLYGKNEVLDIDELELAVSQSNALTELLSNKLDQFVNCKRMPWTGAHGNSILSGIHLLVQSTQDRLNKVFKDTFSAMHPKLP